MFTDDLAVRCVRAITSAGGGVVLAGVTGEKLACKYGDCASQAAYFDVAFHCLPVGNHQT